MYYMARLSLNSGTLETGFNFTWQWSNFKDALSLYDAPFLRSFYYAGIATLIALAIGYPLAYAIAFKGGRWKNAMLFAVVAPFFTTYLIRTIASGITYNFLPFMVLPIYASLERVDESLIEAAKDLYASSRHAFLRVTLPLSLPGIVAGTLLTFIPAVGDYINAFFLGSPSNHMIGNVIQGLYLTQRDYPAAAALSFVLMALIMVAVFIYIRFAGSGALMGEEAVGAWWRPGRPQLPDTSAASRLSGERGRGCASTRSTSMRAWRSRTC